LRTWNRARRQRVYELTEEVGALPRSTEWRLSVVDEALRAQARHRRVWRAGLAAAMLLAVFASLRVGAPGSGAASTGTVTGYIQPCAGALLFSPARQGVFSAAAIVEALRGKEYLKPVGGGISRRVFPAAVAARERVSQNQKFRFDRLSPGQYVILARYAGGNAITWLDVSVIAGRTADVDLPNMCM